MPVKPTSGQSAAGIAKVSDKHLAFTAWIAVDVERAR